MFPKKEELSADADECLQRSDGGDGSSYTNYGGSTAAAGEITPQSKLQPSSR